MKTLSFVIPIYNEKDRIKKTFKALYELELPRGLDLKQIIFVNDGSSDNSVIILQNEKTALEKKLKTTVKIISYVQNKGKGYAIKQGMLASKADYTLFFDADISTPLSEIKKFVPFINNGVDVIVGTRKNGESTVIKHQPLYRELLGKAFTRFTQLILGLDVTDFTCGFKAFSKQSLLPIFSKSRINRWGYDAEILYLAKKNKLSLVEKSVVWSNDDRSKVNLLSAIPQTFLDLAMIQWKHAMQPSLTHLQEVVLADII